MRILQVITSLRTGGAEKLMIDLIPKLKTLGIDTELLLFDGIETPFYKDAKALGIKVHSLEEGGSVYSIKKLFKLIPYMKRYDIIHTHNTAPQLFSAIGSIFNPNIKLVTTEHNTTNRRRKLFGFKILDRWMYNKYKHIICISYKAEENLQKYLGKISTKISTIPNGIFVKNFSEAQGSDELEKLAPKSRKIIMVAAFRHQKDQETLIKSLSFLPPRFHLFLVGEGLCLNKCFNLCKDLGVSYRVHFLGIRSDVPQLLHAADYIVMSSHFEGLSLSSVEGMCVGKPFLASNVDGLEEVVNGAGVLFPHQDAVSLSKEILRLENNPDEYKAVAEACYKRALQYDISEMASKYSDLYKSL